MASSDNAASTHIAVERIQKAKIRMIDWRMARPILIGVGRDLLMMRQARCIPGMMASTLRKRGSAMVPRLLRSKRMEANKRTCAVDACRADREKYPSPALFANGVWKAPVDADPNCAEKRKADNYQRDIENHVHPRRAAEIRVCAKLRI
jgi:hypothetical protein